MKIAYYEESGKMSVVEQERPKIQEGDDAIIRVVRSCVCGSDLWAYSAGDSKQKHSINDGHEAIGIVEEVGESVTTVKPGDFVIVPFTHGAGTVPHVWQALTAFASIMTIISASAHSRSTCASSTPTGPWSRCRGLLLTTAKGCSNPC